MIARDAPCPRHGAPASHAAPARSALERIPGFEVEGELGRGGFASVLVARAADGGEVAIKLALRARADDARFDREADALARLGAPLAPRLIARGALADGRPFLVMERLVGSSLADLMGRANNPCWSWPAARALLAPLAAAVDACHARGLVHRDLKPDNLWLRDGGQMCLFDFGLARTRDDAELTSTGTVLGTPHYMAPEQCRGEADVGAAADRYAVGVIAYELLAGRPPFVGSAAQTQAGHLAQRPPRGQLPETVHDALTHALHKQPERRPPSVAAWLRSLDDAFGAAGAARAPTVVGPSAANDRGPRATAVLHVVGLTDPVAVEAAARAHDGVIATLHARGCAVAFPHAPDAAAGVEAARMTALRLSEHAAAALVIDVGPLTSRETRRGLVLFGAALTTAPHASESVGQVGYTAAAAACRPRSDEAPPPPPSTPLRGRADALAACVEAAQRALYGDGGVATLIGEAGVGKSRYARELALALAAGGTHVVTLAPDGRGPDWLLRGLIECGLGVPAGASLAAIRARVPDASAAASIALALGTIDATDPVVAALLGTPNALRHAAARACRDGLLARAQRGQLAIVVDDADAADHVGLDALELALLCGAPLWVAATARPALRQLRPHWGLRAAARLELALAPLAIDAAAAMMLDQLAPVDALPPPVAAQLYALTGGVPASIAGLAQALRRSGAIHRHAGSSGWYLAADELLSASTSPLAERMAAQLRRDLPPALYELAALAALLGTDVAIDELDAVHRRAAPSGLDTAYAVARLTELALLEPGARPRHVRYRSPALGEAMARSLEPVRRRVLHRAALAVLSEHGDDQARIARHAAAAGELELAFERYAALAAEDARHHRYYDAERHYSAALELLTDDAPRRAPLLAGRGRVRYRVQRHVNALDDLRAARAAAEARGDALATATLLLDEAIVHHWCFDVAADAEAVARARPFVAQADDARLWVRWRNARGRELFAAQRMEEASQTLATAADDAAELGDHETQTLALLLLVSALSWTGAFDEAERRFSELLALCDVTGDRFHLGVAYLNRVALRSQQRRLREGVDDAARATEIARELGNVMLERCAALNRADAHYYLGELDEAESWIRHSAAVRDKVYEHFLPEEPLLLARIAARRGDTTTARAQIAALYEHCGPASRRPVHELLARMVELAVTEDAGPEDWAPVLAASETMVLLADEQQELEGYAARARSARTSARAVVGE